jgi:5-methyltetrahydrofolate--homocysteine methyltransferase
MLDVNAGIPMIDEPAVLADVVRLVQELVEVPLCIDSSIVAALEAGLSVYKGKPLVNSVTGEDERLETVLPLVAEHQAAVIGITNDESGISHDPDARFEVARKIVERAESYGIPRQDVIIDPLAMPVGAVNTAGVNLFTITRRVREELGCNTVCGASNISFGLPDREGLNTAFLAMAISAGMTSAITNPLVDSVRKTVLAGDVFMGLDENCLAWLKYSRDANPEAVGGKRERRRSRRRG